MADGAGAAVSASTQDIRRRIDELLSGVPEELLAAVWVREAVDVLNAATTEIGGLRHSMLTCEPDHSHIPFPAYRNDGPKLPETP